MININKKIIIILALVILATFALTGCGKAPKDAVAKINSDVISKTEFDKNFDMYKNVYEKQYGEDIMNKDAGNGMTFEEVIKEQVLEKLILEKIILDYASKNKIEVTDEEVTERVESYKEVLETKEKYEEFLTENNMTEDNFKEGIKKEMIIDKYRNNFIEGLEIDEKEAKKYFEGNKDKYIKVRASHILVETEEEAKEILEKINSGEEFHALAAKESIDTSTAVKGGDLGYLVKGMIPEFDDIIFSLKTGEVSDVVESDYGFHLIKIDERLEDYEDVKDRVIDNLKAQKYDENLKKMREEAKVKIYMENGKKQDEKSEK